MFGADESESICCRKTANFSFFTYCTFSLHKHVISDTMRRVTDRTATGWTVNKVVSHIVVSYCLLAKHLFHCFAKNTLCISSLNLTIPLSCQPVRACACLMRLYTGTLSSKLTALFQEFVLMSRCCPQKPLTIMPASIVAGTEYLCVWFLSTSAFGTSCWTHTNTSVWLKTCTSHKVSSTKTVLSEMDSESQKAQRHHSSLTLSHYYTCFKLQLPKSSTQSQWWSPLLRFW